MKKYLLLSVLFFTTTFLFSANRFWVGTGANTNWNNTANWSTTSGGAGGASVPTSSDVAVFNGSGIVNCTINASVSVSTFSVTSGYTDTISQGSNTITANNAGGTSIFSGGVFLGGSADITINGNLTISGTKFTSTSGTLNIRSDFTFSSGTFTHNSGSVLFGNGSGVQQVTGSATYNNVEFNRTYRSEERR